MGTHGAHSTVETLSRKHRSWCTGNGCTSVARARTSLVLLLVTILTRDIAGDEIIVSKNETFSRVMPRRENDGNIYEAIGSDLGKGQVILEKDRKDDYIRVVAEARRYWEQRIMSPEHSLKNQALRETCRDQHVLCAHWAIQGECDKNEAYMRGHCPLMCQQCDK